MLANKVFVLQLGNDDEMINGSEAVASKAMRGRDGAFPDSSKYVETNLAALPGWKVDQKNDDERRNTFVAAIRAASASEGTVGLYIVSHGTGGGKLAGLTHVGDCIGLARYIVSLGFTRLEKLNIQACNIGGTAQSGIDIQPGSFLSDFAKTLNEANLTPMIACYKGLNYNSLYDGKGANTGMTKGMKDTIWGSPPPKGSQKEMQTASAKIKEIAQSRHMTLIKSDKNHYTPLAFLPDRSEFKKVVQWDSEQALLKPVDLSLWSAKPANTKQVLRTRFGL